MESRPASPGSASTTSMARLDDSSSSNTSHDSKDSTQEPSHSSSPGTQQPEAMFESRGSLDTLAAAALKPLPEKYGQRHRFPHPHNEQEQEQEQTEQQQQQTQQQQIQQKQHNRLSSHAAHSHESHDSVSGTARSSSGQDRNPRNSSTSSALHHPTPHSEERSSRFHYRDQRQHISDEDSEDDPLLRSRRDSLKEQRLRSPVSHRRSPENSQMEKPIVRSTMSISSLLGDSTTPGFQRKQMSETQTQTQTQAHTIPHSSPERHASQQLVPHRLQEGDAADRQLEESNERGDTLVRPQADNARDHRLAQERQATNPHQHHHHHGHTHNTPHHHHRHLHHREDSGLALPGIDNAAPQHNHAAHHHHHHQRAHPHVHHHHHPQHTHQHSHPHTLAPHHHHHHHAHHHHLHQGKSLSTTKSAFAYMPRSIGLSLNPRLKVNATQVYISYLIQLDQMQRAQHLMRSSEKRKSVQDASSSSLKDTSEYANQSAGHARTASTGEVKRGSQIDRYQEENATTSREGRAGSPPSNPEERKRRLSYNLGSTESNSAPPPSDAMVETTGRASSVVSRSGEHTHHRHQYGHVHVHQHSAPVFPAHIHPAQHHHHVVPLAASKAEKSLVVSSKSNGSQSVHRHHTLHHHHPHHHPYHPNHPNHQHHFHHHTHPAGHNHNHGGHNHAHVHAHGHAHAHGHGHGHGHGPGHAHLHHHSHTSSPSHTGHASSRSHSHRHSKSPSYQKSPSLERVQQQKREQQPSNQLRRRSQILALPAPQPLPASCANGSPTLGGFTESDINGCRRSSNPPLQRQDRRSPSPAHGNTEATKIVDDEGRTHSQQDGERSILHSSSPLLARTEDAMHLD